MKHAAPAAGSALLALACVLHASPTVAGPADHVLSPVVTEGEREIEFKAGTSKLRDGARFNAEELGIGWGVTRWWSTELSAGWQKPADGTHGFDAWEWENIFQLTETGKYPVDIGFVLSIERPKDRAEGYEVRWGPLLQADFSTQWQGNFNLLVEKHVHAEEAGSSELGYQWQVKNRWRRELEFGVQGFGGAGSWNHWTFSEQSHVAGPALFGEFRLGTGRKLLKYNVGWLVGLNHESPRSTLRLQTEFEF